MQEKVKKYRYSEIFGGFGYYDENNKFHPGTLQGEGRYTGIPSVWIRLWGCNKECNGFGQKDPTDTSTYKLEYKDLDVSKYKTMEDLPICQTGCDSSFSWSQKFMSLAHKDTAEDITKKIRQRLSDGNFTHKNTKQECHLVFTGGEPILSQHAVVDIIQQFWKEYSESARFLDHPKNITIETNGSLSLRDDYAEYLKNMANSQHITFFKELFWSVSPKIFATSGETFESSIKPEVVKQYYDVSKHGQFKFVCNGSKQSWDEIEQAVKLYREAGVDWPVWIMPVGATVEGQKLLDADVADQALYRGYNVAARLHVYLYGNGMSR